MLMGRIPGAVQYLIRPQQDGEFFQIEKVAGNCHFINSCIRFCPAAAISVQYISYIGHVRVHTILALRSYEYEELSQNDVVRDEPCCGRVMCYVPILVDTL